MQTMRLLTPALLLLSGILRGESLPAEGATLTQDEGKPRADAGATRTTASPAIASMIAAGLPKYDASQSVVRVAPAAPRPETSSATIVRLPTMIVRDRKLPDKSEVLTKQEMTRQGMDTYIGPENGIDRGFLNLFTVADLWHHLPILGRYKLEGFETNEERGLRLYKEAKLQEEMEELSGLTALGQKADSPASSSKPAGK